MPPKVVSLVPSLTELVFWLGRGDWLAGRTRFCIEPAGSVGSVPVVGGTKNPRIERILDIRPDLVLANKEENRKEDIEALREAGLDVLLTDPNSVAEAVEMVRQVGERLDAEERASQLASDCEALAGDAEGQGPRVFVAIWREPLMGLGSASYGHDLLRACGAVNVLGERPRYPEVSQDELRDLAPELILLPDEPYPFGESHRSEFASIAPTLLIDGKLLWWYGPRMPGAIRELSKLFREGNW